MVEVKNIEVFGLERAQKAIQNSFMIYSDTINREIKPKLSKSLGNNMDAHQSHDAFLKGIGVQFDLKYDAVFIQELMRYHFIDQVMSTSKQHSLEKFFTTKDFNPFNEYVSDEVIKICEQLYNIWNEAKKEYEENKTVENKKRVDESYFKLIFNLPHGFQLETLITTNYLQLKTIVIQRWKHKMWCDWKPFIEACYSIPQFRELCGFTDNKWDLENW